MPLFSRHRRQTWRGSVRECVIRRNITEGSASGWRWAPRSSVVPRVYSGHPHRDPLITARDWRPTLRQAPTPHRSLLPTWSHYTPPFVSCSRDARISTFHCFIGRKRWPVFKGWLRYSWLTILLYASLCFLFPYCVWPRVLTGEKKKIDKKKKINKWMK